jgi:hydroxymethylpyrimidine pyrophosphatase-like HAD family hydrolase
MRGNERVMGKNQKANIQLIAVDMDGTCLDGKKRVPKENLKAIQEACRQGIWVVPTTGRGLHTYPLPIQKLEGIRYVITSNGARITDRQTGKDIREKTIPCTRAAEFLGRLGRATFGTSIQMGGQCLDDSLILAVARKVHYHGDYRYSKLCWRSLTGWVRKQAGKPDAPGIEKINLIFLSKRARKKAMEILKEYPEFCCAVFNPHYMEITAKGATKGEALQALCEYISLQRDQLMAIGDSDNDVPMLRYAGFPVAMGNASPHVKEIAAQVTDTNKNAGVAKIIREVLEAKNSL